MSNLPANPSRFGAIQQMQAHPSWVHDLAYNLWAFTCNQNVARVTQMLNAGTYRDDGGIVPEDAYGRDVVDDDGVLTHDPDALPIIQITRQAVSNWKKAERWDEKWASQMQDLAPSLHRTVANNIMSASVVASEFLMQYLSGEIMTIDPTIAKQLDSRAKVAQDILNRSGHLPHQRPNDGGPLVGPSENHAKQLVGKSMDELRRMALGMDSDIVDV